MRHECSKTARVEASERVRRGISAYSAVVPVVIKVIIGTAPSAGASAPPRSSRMTTATRGEKEGKRGEDTRTHTHTHTHTQQMKWVALYHSNKGSYIGKHVKYFYSGLLSRLEQNMMRTNIKKNAVSEFMLSYIE